MAWIHSVPSHYLNHYQRERWRRRTSLFLWKLFHKVVLRNIQWLRNHYQNHISVPLVWRKTLSKLLLYSLSNSHQTFNGNLFNIRRILFDFAPHSLILGPSVSPDMAESGRNEWFPAIIWTGQLPLLSNVTCSFDLKLAKKMVSGDRYIFHWSSWSY